MQQDQNTILLNQYYSSITNSVLFEKMLDNNYQLYFYPRLENWKAERNKDLLKNEHLQSRIELLTIYNRLLCRFLGKIISSYKFVIEWKNNGTKIHADGLKIRRSEAIDFLTQQYPYIIGLNKSNDVVLAYTIKEYCLNAINLMVGFLKIELCIDIVKSPIYAEIENLINEIENSVSYKEIKIALKVNKNKKPQQNEVLKNDEVLESEPLKEMHNNIFVGNSFEVWERYKENKNINGSSAADLRVIFDLMKADNLIQETIELKHWITWLNSEYFDGTIITLKKQHLDTKPNIVRTNDYNEYKKATLK